jgi:hypothetical protein
VLLLLPAVADDVCDDRRMAVVVWTWRKREGPRVGRAWNAVETGVERSKRRAVADLILVRVGGEVGGKLVWTVEVNSRFSVFLM